MTRSNLTRDVAILLAVKVVALAVIYFVFFAPASHRDVDAGAHLIGSPSAPTQAQAR